jgi:hypothetical protein
MSATLAQRIIEQAEEIRRLDDVQALGRHAKPAVAGPKDFNKNWDKGWNKTGQ